MVFRGRSPAGSEASPTVAREAFGGSRPVVVSEPAGQRGSEVLNKRRKKMAAAKKVAKKKPAAKKVAAKKPVAKKAAAKKPAKKAAAKKPAKKAAAKKK